MAKKFVKGFSLGDTEGCCGVTQIYSFLGNRPLECEDYNGQGATEQAAWEALFHQLLTLSEGFVYQIWFVKLRNFEDDFNDTFEAEPLRELICGIDGCVCLGTTVNPNSGNIIEGYQWIGK